MSVWMTKANLKACHWTLDVPWKIPCCWAANLAELYQEKQWHLRMVSLGYFGSQTLKKPLIMGPLCVPWPQLAIVHQCFLDAEELGSRVSGAVSTAVGVNDKGDCFRGQPVYWNGGVSFYSLRGGKRSREEVLQQEQGPSKHASQMISEKLVWGWAEAWLTLSWCGLCLYGVE